MTWVPNKSLMCYAHSKTSEHHLVGDNRALWRCYRGLAESFKINVGRDPVHKSTQWRLTFSRPAIIVHKVWFLIVKSVWMKDIVCDWPWLPYSRLLLLFGTAPAQLCPCIETTSWILVTVCHARSRLIMIDKEKKVDEGCVDGWINSGRLPYHICSLIFFPSSSIVLILKSIPVKQEHFFSWETKYVTPCPITNVKL